MKFMRWSFTKQEKFSRNIGTHIIGKQNDQSRFWLVKACYGMAVSRNDREVTNSRIVKRSNRYFPQSVFSNLDRHLDRSTFSFGRNKVGKKMQNDFACFCQGDSSVLHCASLLRTIFASLTRANECVVQRVRIHNIRDFPQAYLEREIYARFLLNEYDDLYFFIS